jgi:hypothetical protein
MSSPDDVERASAPGSGGGGAAATRLWRRRRSSWVRGVLLPRSGVAGGHLSSTLSAERLEVSSMSSMRCFQRLICEVSTFPLKFSICE